jgi:hypothetical protein
VLLDTTLACEQAGAQFGFLGFLTPSEYCVEDNFESKATIEEIVNKFRNISVANVFSAVPSTPTGSRQRSHPVWRAAG